MTDWLQTVDDILDCLPGSSLVDPEYWYHSFYRGDSHADYAGSHRVRSVVEFDWDGKVISGFKATGDFGQSHREWEAKAWLDTIVGKHDLGYWFDAESDRATSEVSGSGGGNRFAIGLKSGNPLLMTVNPDINADLTGWIAPDGGLSLHYETDSFPSHGVQVSRDGNVIHTGITNDASGVAVLGPVGAANIGTSLMRPAQWKGNSGGMVLPGGGVTGSIPTK